MTKFRNKCMELIIDEDKGVISSFKLDNKEITKGECPLFIIRFRDLNGKFYYVDSYEATKVNALVDGFEFSGFGKAFSSLTVKTIIKADDEISWYIEIDSVPKEYAIEWVEYPKICVPRLIDNDENGGKLLFPYDEGTLLSDDKLLPRYEPEFPFSGAYFIFPNKLCSQFMAYLFDDIGFYIGAHDKERGFKGVDFYKCNDGLALQIRLYSGVNYGDGYKSSFPIVWRACDGNWKSASLIYRSWLESNLPHNMRPINENKALPSWYKEQPLIVTYPVRGAHDMDEMKPNALFPYMNAMPILNKIKEAVSTRIMALLMHWEGTAPWAPPYVWPPYGGLNLFNEFRDALHKNGDLLGVYCSGFGYTTQSTLIKEYNLEEKIKKENVLSGVCHSPQNEPVLGITCTPYQRYGYDICPVSNRGREILDEAYTPVFESGIDYAQILDQNHGGGQHMCYARGHLHPPMPGKWMTSSMQELLSDWNKRASGMLFGCESAASEPFIGGLLMSDNRFELNYPFGTPVPVYSFIYHPYVRNFMGNQCGCPFEPAFDTIRYRLGYSFSIGDFMTLVIAPNGDLMTHWSTRDFDHAPNMEKALLFIKNLTKFYNEVGHEYLCSGKMSASPDIECDTISIPLTRGQEKSVLPRLLSSTWERADGRVAYIVVNPECENVKFKINSEEFEAPPLDAMLIIR